MKGSFTYQERQTVSNLGEDLFEQYCIENNYKFNRLGFDEKNASVPNFFKLNSLIRNLPDYVITKGNETLIVNVKGTGNFKKKEVDLIPLFLEWYSTKEAPLVYAFCFKGEAPKFIYPEKVIELYSKSRDQRWSDGVVYRNLNL